MTKTTNFNATKVLRDAKRHIQKYGWLPNRGMAVGAIEHSSLGVDVRVPNCLEIAMQPFNRFYKAMDNKLFAPDVTFNEIIKAFDKAIRMER